MDSGKEVSTWSIDDVSKFLGTIGLVSLQDAFMTNAVNGADLLVLSDEDFKESLGATPLQVS